MFHNQLTAGDCLCCRSLLQELIAIAKATCGKEPTVIDLSPVGDDFDPSASI